MSTLHGIRVSTMQEMKLKSFVAKEMAAKSSVIG